MTSRQRAWGISFPTNDSREPRPLGRGLLLLLQKKKTHKIIHGCVCCKEREKWEVSYENWVRSYLNGEVLLNHVRNVNFL